MTDKKAILRSISSMKPLSASAARLMSIVSDPDHSIAEIVAVVRNDAVLTGNVLRLVNSAAFGLTVRIETVERAVSYVGGNMVAGIAMGLCVPHVFNDPLEGYNSERGALWRHSLRTAIAAREIARTARQGASPAIAYTAGILHDIGKGVISAHLIGYGEELEAAAKSHEPPDFLAAEMEITGTTHCEVGEALAEHWNLPDPLTQVIAHHHHPGNADPDYKPLVYAVHLADYAVMLAGAGTGTDTLLYGLDEDYMDHSPVTPAQLEGIIKDSEQELEKAAEALIGNG